MTKPLNTLYPVAVESQVREWASEQKHWFPYYVHGKCSTGACWWTLRLSQRTANSFSFICYFICFVCWLTCVNQGGECVRKLLRHCGGKTRHMIWDLNFARGSRVCIVVRSRRANQVYRLSVDHRNFTRIDVDEFLKCRTEYEKKSKIWTCEEIYFQGSEELKLNVTGCITYNLW